MTVADLSNWPTKQEAAAQLGVSTKAIERFVKAGKLEQRLRPQAGAPAVAVYFPDDVAKLAQARQQSPAPFVLRAERDGPPANGRSVAAEGQRLIQIDPVGISAVPDPLRAFATALVHAVLSQTSETSTLPPTVYVTLREASAITGLTQAYLRRAIDGGTLKAVRDRGWRIRRRDLEQL